MKKLVLLCLSALILLPSLSVAVSIDEACSGSGIISCMDFNSVSDITDHTTVAAPNTPGSPWTKTSCKYFGGERSCFPVFQGTCAQKDASELARSQDTVDGASLWSPCYDETENALRFTYWNDLGKNLQQAHIDSFPSTDTDHLYIQFDMKMSSELFFDPAGWDSSTIAAVNRGNSCQGGRYIEHKFTKIAPDHIEIAPFVHCSTERGTGFDAVTFSAQPTLANHWIRITTHYDFVNDHIDMTIYDLTDNQELFSGSTDESNGVALVDDQNLGEFWFKLYANNHQIDTSKPSPHLWLRNAILSTEPISFIDSNSAPEPTPEEEPTPETDPSPDPEPQPTPTPSCTKLHEADTICATDGEDDCGISEQELRKYARKVVKKQRTIIDLVAAMRIFLNLETHCPTTFARKRGGAAPTPEPGPVPEDLTPPPAPGLPEITPGPTDSAQHFSAECSKPGVLACNSLTSIENITDYNTAGAPSTPLNPLTNGKCKWNGGTHNCYPTFEGTCSQKDQQLIDPGRSQDTPEQASLWSPCYDDQADATRLTFWSDRGSSVQQVQTLIVPQEKQQPNAHIWHQFEFSPSKEFFFDPQSTSTAKVGRFYKKKKSGCNSEHFATMRFLHISPQSVHIGPLFVCGRGGFVYGNIEDGTRVALKVDEHAGHWIRITTHFDSENNAINFWAYDVTDGEMVTQGQTVSGSYRDVTLNFGPEDLHAGRYDFLLHSSSHEPVPGHTSPHYWVRNTIMSTEPISP